MDMRSIVLRVIQGALICTCLMMLAVAYLAMCEHQYIGSTLAVISGMICVQDFLPRLI